MTWIGIAFLLIMVFFSVHQILIDSMVALSHSWEPGNQILQRNLTLGPGLKIIKLLKDYHFWSRRDVTLMWGILRPRWSQQPCLPHSRRQYHQKMIIPIQRSRTDIYVQLANHCHHSSFERDSTNSFPTPLCLQTATQNHFHLQHCQ